MTHPWLRRLPAGNWPLTLLVTAVAAAGLALLGLGATQHTGHNLAALLTLAALAALAERYAVDLFGDSHVSVSVVAILAAAAIGGLWGLAIVVPLTALAAHLDSRCPWYKTLFNAGAWMLGGAAFTAALELAGVADGSLPWPRVLLPGLGGAAVNFAVNSSLVAGAIALSQNRPLPEVWQDKYRWLLPHYLVLGVAALALASTYDLLGLWAIAVFALPVLTVRYGLVQYAARSASIVRQSQHFMDQVRMMEAFSASNWSALEAVAATADLHEAASVGHAQRLAEAAAMVATRLGLQKEGADWVALRQAALLHDLGLLALSSAHLDKAGPLSDEERSELRKHPTLAHAMLAESSQLRDVASIVRAHHERVDGTGYPRGLRGSGIPLGARILAVCDAFDAMVTGRPYRQPLPLEVAVAELKRHSGSQFDPAVVDAFIEAVCRAAESPWKARRLRARQRRVA